MTAAGEGSTPFDPPNNLRNCGREVRHLIVDQVDDGSSPFSSANPVDDAACEAGVERKAWGVSPPRSYRSKTFESPRKRAEVLKCPRAVARFTGCEFKFSTMILGLTPQALCLTPASQATGKKLKPAGFKHYERR